MARSFVSRLLLLVLLSQVRLGSSIYVAFFDNPTCAGTPLGTTHTPSDVCEAEDGGSDRFVCTTEDSSSTWRYFIYAGTNCDGVAVATIAGAGVGCHAFGTAFARVDCGVPEPKSVKFKDIPPLYLAILPISGFALACLFCLGASKCYECLARPLPGAKQPVALSITPRGRLGRV